MGQGHSSTPQNQEDVGLLFAHRCAKLALKEVELYTFKRNFAELADETDGLLYWPAPTFLRFLGIPDIFDVGEILFSSASYIAAFPFPHSLAPSPLTLENLLKVIVIFTGRLHLVVKSQDNITKLLFDSFAVFDRSAERASEEQTEEFDLKTLESLDEIQVLHLHDKVEMGTIPVSTFRKLLVFLLAIRHQKPNEPLAAHIVRFTSANVADLQKIADGIIAALVGEENEMINFPAFKTYFERSMPFLFEPMGALFGRFFYSQKDLQIPKSVTSNEHSHTEGAMGASVSALLALFLPATRLAKANNVLYIGSRDGFSMNSFESHVFKYNAPTLLLIRGRRFAFEGKSKQEEDFLASLPTRRYQSGYGTGEDLLFGALINTAWKHTTQGTFGDKRSLLFQLRPHFEVYPASSVQKYVYFSKTLGIGFGHEPYQPKKYTTDGLGPLSLYLTSSLDYGVFRHLGPGGGYVASESRRRHENIEEIFEILELTVYGIGSEEDGQKQKEAWEWEANEAEKRRHVNLGGDLEENRSLLELVGILDTDRRSGGSV